MPGIVGLVTKQARSWAEPQLLRMVESMRHESFYRTGTWIDESSGVYLGWTVLEDSFSDGMPLQNQRGDTVLVFSGEEFSQPLVQSKNGGSRGTGSSYLIKNYEENAKFPANLNGMFHGFLRDRSEGTTTLFNDRYGMHRVYYHEAKDAFYFAAEAKAILEARPELRRANLQGLGDFVACGCVLENRTVFEGIQVLPGGSAWSFRGGAVESKKTYFEPQEWEAQATMDPESYYQELREVFSRNLPLYFNGQEPIGVALTGGLDSRVIMAWRKAPPNSTRCYTFGGTLRECQDVMVARRVARVCQQPHQVIELGDEFLSSFSHYAERTMYLTEGCVDVSRATDLYVSERARQIAPIKVVGTYGSEILCQLAMFKAVEPASDLFHPELVSCVKQAAATYAGLRSQNPVTFAAFRQSPWYHYGILSLEQTQLTVRSPYLDNDFVRTVFRAPKPDRSGNDVRLRLIRDGNPALSQFPSDRGVGGNATGLAAAASRNFIKFTVKAEYAYDYGMPEWLARVDHVLAPLHLERLFLGRHKLAHFRIWYRDALAPYVQEVLLDQRTLSRPYLNRKRVESVVQGHLKGNRNYTGEIHKLLSLELLHRIFLDPR